jgi:hypothetical protein
MWYKSLVGESHKRHVSRQNVVMHVVAATAACSYRDSLHTVGCVLVWHMGSLTLFALEILAGV